MKKKSPSFFFFDQTLKFVFLQILEIFDFLRMKKKKKKIKTKYLFNLNIIEL